MTTPVQVRRPPLDGEEEEEDDDVSPYDKNGGGGGCRQLQYDNRRPELLETSSSSNSAADLLFAAAAAAARLQQQQQHQHHQGRWPSRPTTSRIALSSSPLPPLNSSILHEGGGGSVGSPEDSNDEVRAALFPYEHDDDDDEDGNDVFAVNDGDDDYYDGDFVAAEEDDPFYRYSSQFDRQHRHRQQERATSPVGVHTPRSHRHDHRYQRLSPSSRSSSSSYSTPRSSSAASFYSSTAAATACNHHSSSNGTGSRRRRSRQQQQHHPHHLLHRQRSASSFTTPTYRLEADDEEREFGRRRISHSGSGGRQQQLGRRRSSSGRKKDYRSAATTATVPSTTSCSSFEAYSSSDEHYYHHPVTPVLGTGARTSGSSTDWRRYATGKDGRKKKCGHASSSRARSSSSSHRHSLVRRPSELSLTGGVGIETSAAYKFLLKRLAAKGLVWLLVVVGICSVCLTIAVTNQALEQSRTAAPSSTQREDERAASASILLSHPTSAGLRGQMLHGLTITQHAISTVAGGGSGSDVMSKGENQPKTKPPPLSKVMLNHRKLPTGEAVSTANTKSAPAKIGDAVSGKSTKKTAPSSLPMNAKSEKQQVGSKAAAATRGDVSKKALTGKKVSEKNDHSTQKQLLELKLKPSPAQADNSVYRPQRVVLPSKKIMVKSRFDMEDKNLYRQLSPRGNNKKKSPNKAVQSTTTPDESNIKRTVVLHESVLRTTTPNRPRKIQLYPPDFTDNTQLYGILDSKDERLAGMEIREPLVKGDCVPMKEWQTTFHPSCNSMHEFDLAQAGGNSNQNGLDFRLFGTKGYWRNAWSVKAPGGNKGQSDTVVLKTLK